MEIFGASAWGLGAAARPFGGLRCVAWRSDIVNPTGPGPGPALGGVNSRAPRGRRPASMGLMDAGLVSGATVLVVKGAFVYFLALHLLRLPRRPMLQHGVKNSQQLMHARRQGDFFDFPRREEPFVKDFDLRVEARGHQRAHV